MSNLNSIKTLDVARRGAPPTRDMFTHLMGLAEAYREDAENLRVLCEAQSRTLKVQATKISNLERQLRSSKKGVGHAPDDSLDSVDR